MSTHLNLLPLKFRQQAVIKRIIRQWLAVGGVVGLVLLSLSLFTNSQLTAEKIRVATLNEQAEPIRELMSSNRELEAQLQELQLKKESIDNITNSNLHLQTLGIISQNAKQLQDNLQVIHFSLEETARPQFRQDSVTASPQTETPPETSRRSMRLKLRGLSVDEASVANFIALLEGKNRFQRVDLKSIDRTEISNFTMQTFEIECLF